MMNIYKMADTRIVETHDIEDGVWVNLIAPTAAEIEGLAERLQLDPDWLTAALDEEERSRIDTEPELGQTLILVDVPFIDIEPGCMGEQQSFFGSATSPGRHSRMYDTLPLGIIYTPVCIVTVCLKESPVTQSFIENRIKTFYTHKKSRFILQILYRTAELYLFHLKQIDKQSVAIEAELHKSMKNKELIQLLDLEKSLVYFSTSLKGNELVMERLLRFEFIRKYPDDTELLEDTIIENKQAIEMAKIYSDILAGTMDAFASVISNNLNIVMKFLASITIVMSIPTMISGFFGMNVLLPLEDHPWAFVIIIVITLAACGTAAWIMARKKMF